MPLPFELRAVEMALKDSKGRNIADKLDELDSKPAGTKLYLHHITGTGRPVDIISPEPTNYKDIRNLSIFFQQAVSIRSGTCIVYAYSGGQYWSINVIDYSPSVGTFITVSVSMDTSILTDTVTPL